MRIGNNMITGTVTRVAFDDGPAYDVQTNEGATYRGVKVRGVGASSYPVLVGQTVHMIRPRGAYDLPFITGADLLSIVEKTPDASASETYAPDARRPPTPPREQHALVELERCHYRRKNDTRTATDERSSTCVTRRRE